MAIFNAATFDSLDQIPETYTGNPRDEFEQVNGKWRLKASAIPGVGELFNSALAANAQKAVDQVKKKGERIVELESQLNEVKDQLSNFQSPGSVVLSADDAKNWQKLVQLIQKHGSLKAIEDAVEEYPKLKDKLSREEQNKALEDLAKEIGVNASVLKDWANHPEEGQGLTFFSKEVDALNDKKQPVKIKQGFVKIERKNEAGKVEVSEMPLSELAKKNLPDWKQTALFTVATSDQAGGSASTGQPGAAGAVKQPVIGNPGGVTIPGSSAGSGGDPSNSSGDKKPAARFQAERDKIKSPFDVPDKPAGLF